ncbi:OmpA family protein [Photobacterium sp. CCB-ST2H9]|uniref:OmpA n=1 Tax=Photobacterium galatheae TaxID=1654360 RepID=A0A066RSP6_9GAMM|nr:MULTISPECIES: OmpA family protein [Photobacterium]KDM93485.1 ompA [Photobacterium galatheae]MCM0147066.1 OmpA family protein [Photobacterium galatheae]UTM56091.1 OmpA family protein [Photobacterium sp. CCB-ST2H9]
MSTVFDRKSSEQDESHWLSVSDLMAGLMMVFLFIAIALMQNAFKERDKIKEVAVAYQDNQVAIYEALQTEFSQDLSRWNADIDEDTLTFTFKAPEVLFKEGSSMLSPDYRSLLDEFFPRYMTILMPFKESINEIRIEGHTSSDWNSLNADDAYFENMRLSQERTRSVLRYVYSLKITSNYSVWVKSHFSAVGLSSSKLIYDENGTENKVRSRRVSFRVLTNADIQIKQILQGEES